MFAHMRKKVVEKTSLMSSEHAFKVWFMALTVLLLLAGSAGAFLFMPGSASAQTAVEHGKPVQVSELNMLDQRTGWALAQDRAGVLYTQQGPERWVDVTPPGLNLPPNDVMNSITASYFLDASRGYIGVLQDGQTSLLFTQDSGKTWETVAFDFSPLSMVGIYQIEFIDAQHGWLAFDKHHGFGQYHVVLMSTNDGGKSWKQLLDTTEDEASGVPIYWPKHFHFTSEQQGWMIGNEESADVRLYATSDGGKTWSPQGVAPVENGLFTASYGPYFRGSQTATLPVTAGLTDGSTSNLLTYRTTDGGKTWKLGEVLSAPGFTEFRALTFRTANEGWSLGLNEKGTPVIHQTRNGGQSWNTLNPQGLESISEVILDLDFASPTRGWTINKAEDGTLTLFETRNGGRSWQALQPVVR